MFVIELNMCACYRYPCDTHNDKKTTLAEVMISVMQDHMQRTETKWVHWNDGDAESIQGWGLRMGCPTAQPTRSLVERREFLQPETQPQTPFRQFLTVIERFR